MRDFDELVTEEEYRQHCIEEEEAALQRQEAEERACPECGWHEQVITDLGHHKAGCETGRTGD